MGDDHVPVGAGVVVEIGASLNRERLGRVDLHVGDVLAVPHRLEQAVGEPEGQDVAHRLLAEEVVDPEHLRLAEEGVHRLVQRAGRGQVGAERLLDDDAGTGGQARRAEHGHRRLERGRRDGQMAQPPRRAADLPLRPLDRCGQCVGAAGLRAGEGEPALERLPRLAGGFDGPELGDRLAGVLTELLTG